MGGKDTVTKRFLRDPKSLTPQQRKKTRYNLKNRVRRHAAFLKQAAESNDAKTRKFVADELEGAFGIRNEEADSDIQMVETQEITIVSHLKITFHEENRDRGGKTRTPAAILDKISGFLRR